MKVLVVGSGGREHALAWKLLQSPSVGQVFCTPGNGGTATLAHCQNLAFAVDDFEGIGRFAQDNDIALVVVGPESPLAMGITDTLQSQGISVFGPTQAGAQLESSKSWAKALMEAAGVPTANAQSFTDMEAAKTYVHQQGIPIVIKADGLAAGKGVTVATTMDAAFTALEQIFQGQFGAAGNRVLVEEYLTGQELSVLALTDGLTIRPLLPAQDHKPIGEGDTGPNTGGMGAYTPVPFVNPSLIERVQEEILTPVLEALQTRKIDYRGVLYAGLIVTPEGNPKVIEFNCRFGDPEVQAILPLLETPLDTLLMACTQQNLADQTIHWRSEASACIVMAAEGYPGRYEKNRIITGIKQAESTGTQIFQAGTKFQNNQLLTNGGRVLAVTAQGATFDQALEHAYEAIAHIQFDGSYYRRDIGYRVRSNQP